MAETMNNWEISSLPSDDEGDRNQTQQINGKSIEQSNGIANKSDQQHVKKSRKSNQRLSRKLWKVFAPQSSTPPGGKVTPVEDGVNTPPSPAIIAFSKQSMKTASIKSSSEFKNQNDSLKAKRTETTIKNMSHHDNPVFIPSSIEEGPELMPNHGKRSYQAAIHSVNSAGRPVPITIEESENDDDTANEIAGVDDEYQSNSHRMSSETPPVPSASAIFPRYTLCCFSTNRENQITAFVKKLWQKSYLPSSTVIFVWLCIVTAAFLYNLWTIPLRATFLSEIQTPWQDGWFSFDAICDLIYVIDIFMKFRTCYIQSGVFVTDLNLLNRYHRREWTLILDILAILPTDFLFLHTINPYFRLNRLFKVHRVYKFYLFGELNTWSPNLWRSLTLFHIFFVSIHYNACIYYSLSSTNGFGALLTSWSYPNPQFFPDYEPMYRRYTYSFYWCMVGLGLVNDRYFPETDWQFSFSIYLHFLGFLFLVVFVGFFTVVMLDQISRKFNFEKTMRDTKDYLKSRDLPKDLQLRVMRFYQYSWLSEQFPHLDEGSVLKPLPIAVRQEIEYHSKFNALKQISSFAKCDDKIIRDLVMKLQRTIYLPGQFVYKSGDSGKEVYIVGDGILQVVSDGDPDVRTLRNGDVFGEMDFLRESEKRRIADVVSYGYSVIYMLNCEDVWDAFRKYPKFLNQIQQQDKRRRTATTSGIEYKAFGNRYQSVPTSSGRSRDSKLSSSKVNFQITNRFHGSSPDSGMPSTPSMGIPYEGESPTALHRDRLKFEVTEKVTGLYQEHIKSLKASLDTIWFQELEYLQQRLEDTEQERDLKTKEILRLRRQTPKDHTKASFPTNIKGKTSDNDANNSTAASNTGNETTNTSINGKIKSVQVKKSGEKLSVKRKSSNVPAEATTSF